MPAGVDLQADAWRMGQVFRSMTEQYGSIFKLYFPGYGYLIICSLPSAIPTVLGLPNLPKIDEYKSFCAVCPLVGILTAV